MFYVYTLGVLRQPILTGGPIPRAIMLATHLYCQLKVSQTCHMYTTGGRRAGVGLGLVTAQPHPKCKGFQQSQQPVNGFGEEERWGGGGSGWSIWPMMGAGIVAASAAASSVPRGGWVLCFARSLSLLYRPFPVSQ